MTLGFEHRAKPIVYGDPHLLRQLVGNLVDNAIKFTERGRGRRHASARPPTSAWVEVADTGPGIPEQERPYIFERFYRADKARSRSGSRDGLGLAIVRSIARVHGGEATAGRSPSGRRALSRGFTSRQGVRSPTSHDAPRSPARTMDGVHGGFRAGGTRDARSSCCVLLASRRRCAPTSSSTLARRRSSTSTSTVAR